MAREYLATLKDTTVIVQERDVTLAVESWVGWVVLDLAGRPVNVMNLELMSQIDKVWAELDKLIKSGAVKVIVIASGKKDTFIAGADVLALYPLTDRKLIEEAARQCQSVFDRIEKFSIPTIAAINGPALGAGCELALSCTWRVSADHKKVQIGLPEVKLGLLPGGGGTVRLPRRIGLQNALPIILAGGQVNPKKAKALGLVDEVFDSTDRSAGENRFFSSVRAFAIKKSGTSTHRSEYTPKTFKDRLLENTRVGQYLISSQAVKGLDKQTKGKYPGSYFALDSTMNSVNVSKSEALKLEAKHFGTLGASPPSKALISLFFMMEESKKRKEKTNNANIVPVNRIGVIGAGVMGAQIAVILASKGKSVYMRDIKDDFVKKGLALVESTNMAKVKKGRMTLDKAKATIGLVQGGTDIQPFAKCNLFIEAAVEAMPLKKKILAQVEEVAPENTIFATNTSSLSITELASSSKRPQNVVGLHFFNPVNKMPLVEIIRGKQTSDEAAATAYQLALDLGKIPVICNDCPGFIVNRILGIYMNEAGHLATEGYSIPEIDKALLDFGMPMGPFRLMDEVGLDVAGHVGPILENGLGDRYKQIPEFAKVLHENPKHLGKKTGSGFFLYDETGKQGELNPIVHQQIAAIMVKLRRSSKPKSSSSLPTGAIKPENVRPGTKEAQKLIVDRCVLIMLNEALYILDEKIVASPGDLDLAMIMGTGFAPFTGGLLAYADSRGLQDCVSTLIAIQKTYGSRFTPHPKLVDMATKGERFFPNRPNPKALTPITKLPRSKL